MKIYEVRDITDDESYYTKGFFTDKEQAIAVINNPEGYDVADDPSCYNSCYNYVLMAVYEWETEVFEKGHKKIFEVEYKIEYQEDTDESKWTHSVVYPKAEVTT